MLDIFKAHYNIKFTADIILFNIIVNIEPYRFKADPVIIFMVMCFYAGQIYNCTLIIHKFRQICFRQCYTGAGRKQSKAFFAAGNFYYEFDGIIEAQ